MPKRAKKAATPKAAAKPTAVSVSVEASPDVPVYYINYAEISHGAHDFGMAVARVATKLPARVQEEALKSGRVVIEPILQLVMPPTIIPGLISALQRQREAYEKNFVPIQDVEKGKKRNGRSKDR